MKTLRQVEAIDAICESTYKDLEITEAEYQGKKVKLNDPIRGGSKKFYVYVKNPKGNIVKVSFGDTTGLSIKRDDPAGGWVHISYHESDSNRKQVLTFDGKKYTEGLPDMEWKDGKVVG